MLSLIGRSFPRMRKRIVILDGNSQWRRFSAEVLASEGYDINAFGDMEQALKHVLANHGDLIIADYEWSRAHPTSFQTLRRMGYTNRLVFLLRNRNPRVLRDCFKAGARDCVPKPKTREALSSIIGEAIHQRSHLAVTEGLAV